MILAPLSFYTLILRKLILEGPEDICLILIFIFILMLITLTLEILETFMEQLISIQHTKFYFTKLPLHKKIAGENVGNECT